MPDTWADTSSFIIEVIMNTAANILTSLAALKEPLEQHLRQSQHDIIHVWLYGLGVLAGTLFCLVCSKGMMQHDSR
jgi:type III secretory pathway component EscU